MSAPSPRSAPHPKEIQLAGLAFALLAPGDGGHGPEADWLNRWRSHLRSAASDPAAAWQTWLATPPEEDARLRAVAGELRLSTAETIAVALAVAVEVEAMAGRALAWLQAPTGTARPTVGLVALVAASIDGGGPAAQIAALAGGRATNAGLLTLDDDSRPLPECSLRVPAPLALALAGAAGPWPGIEGELADPPPLSESANELSHRYANACASGRTGLVIRSGQPREARAAAQLIARNLGAAPAFLTGDPPAGLGPWLWLTRRVPVICPDPAPGERLALPPLPGYPGPILVATGPDGAFTLDDEPVTSWALPIPEPVERIALWVTATGDPELARALGGEFRHGAGRIQGLTKAGRFQATLEGAQKVTSVHIAEAGRRGAAADLGSVAELIAEPIHDNVLVLPPQLRVDLDALLLRCTGRDSLAANLGQATRARHKPGVRALLYGPSGTGKTLAAGWLATRLGLPLYRVDLSSVTSKYIGETEKNLSRLFARAEHAEVVLMFDEADALFGKRTDVKDSNDRYANAQTNYLLQRIESFEGITILTSNSRARFDSAFARRLDAIIEFPLPAPDERRALWLAHLGTDHRLTPGDLNRLAAGCELAGGHIRNAVLAAAATARNAGRPIKFADLAAGVVAEFRKLGKQPPSPFVSAS